MKTSKLKIIFICILLALSFANFSHAQIVQCGGLDNNGHPQPDCTPSFIISEIKYIINFLLSWAWLISIFMIVVSGIRMVISRGNEEAISQAKTSLQYAILGFIVIMVAFVVVNFVVALLTGEGSLNPGAINDAFHLIP